MEVILLKDVKGLGRQYECVVTADGFARNSLIPKGLAVEATPSTRATYGAIAAVREEKIKAIKNAAREALQRARGLRILLAVQADPKGHLFAKVGKREISRALHEKGIILSEEAIVLPEPIRALGEYEVTLRTEGESTTVLLSVARASIG